MPNLIITHFEPLCVFLLPLIASLSAPQQRHALNMVGALLVCTGKRKLLTVLTAMLRLPHSDATSLADFFSQSTWKWEAIRTAVLQHLVAVAIRVARRQQVVRIFLALDDALCVKDVATHALQAVGFCFDHVQPRRQWKQFSNASRYVALCLCLGGFSFPVTWRLYLRRDQVRALNRGRAPADRLVFQSLPDLALAMLQEVADELPADLRATVYVLFDAWFASKPMLQHVRAFSRPSQPWHFLCASRSNRTLDGVPFPQWWSKLSATQVRRVRTGSTKGSHTYLTRSRVGRLRQGCTVTLVISKRHRRDRSPVYFLTSDTRLSAETVVKYYRGRWECECANWFLKEQLGLADYRVQSVDAIQRWHTLVFAAYAFVAVRRAESWLHDPATPLLTNSDVLNEQRRWHFEQLVRCIAQRARNGASDQQLLTELFPPT